MPSKLQTYMQMADEAQRQITGSYRGWTGFLTTAARLYKYPYSQWTRYSGERCSSYPLTDCVICPLPFLLLLWLDRKP